MEYPIRTVGRAVELCPYRVDYTRKWTGQDEAAGEQKELEAPETAWFPTRAEADKLAARRGGTVTEVDTAAYAWLDGLTVPDGPDPYAEAVELCRLGQAGYARKQGQAPEQLRADVDYILLMGGY